MRGPGWEIREFRTIAGIESQSIVQRAVPTIPNLPAEPMRVHILPTSVQGTPGHGLTGFVVDGVLALDAGQLGQCGTCVEQSQIRDVLLTHSHIDHVAGLPTFLDNVYGIAGAPPTLHALKPTLDALQTHLFSGQLWPDFIGLSRVMAPFVAIREVEPNRPFPCGRYTAIAIPLEHTVPTVAYLLDDGRDAFALMTDTGPVPELFEKVGRWPRLRGLFLECSFPRRLHELANASQHLTTDQFADAVALLPPGLPVFATHIKPRDYEETVAELRALGLKNVQIGEPGRVVEFR